MSIKNTGNAVAIQEHDGRGQRMCQCCVTVLIFHQAAQKNSSSVKVTTSVEEPPMMTVAPLYRDCLNLPRGSLNNSVHCK